MCVSQRSCSFINVLYFSYLPFTVVWTTYSLQPISQNVRLTFIIISYYFEAMATHRLSQPLEETEACS